MENLYLRGNFFYGEIPDIRGLVGLKRVDLSNNISGSILRLCLNPHLIYYRFSIKHIPGYFSSFPLLEYLNQSNNNFEGRVPTKAKFQNFSIVLVSGNNNLCGGIKDLKLKPCFEIAPPMDTERPSLLKKVVIGVSTTIIFLLLLVITSLSPCWFIKRKRNLQTDNPTPSALETFHGNISYRDIRTATDDFSLSNLIGSGSFGTVFKALLPTMDKVVAVKVLNMERRGAKKSFMAEFESLKIIRHHNLNMEWEEYMVIGIALVFFFWKRSLEKDQPVNCLKETIHYTATPSQRCQTQVLDIVDKSMLHSCLRDGFPLVECLTLILEVGLRCCEGSPTSRLAMSQADKELISVRERFYKSRKCSREDTNGADNHVG
ncbi:unnamed protein product [Brassica napus]|uniref:(rape) hypothetical protein n=1 Tax=Brassica napus TaxID=3708 RepID=A0A816KB35_BRANA|nr:unnamed protein product [Brassica napus]